MSTPRFILKRDRDESGKKIVPDDEINKPKEKVVTPPTKKELQELKEEYVVQCTKVSNRDPPERCKAVFIIVDFAVGWTNFHTSGCRISSVLSLTEPSVRKTPG